MSYLYSDNDHKLRPWQVIDDQEVFTAQPWIRVFQQRILLPNGHIVEDYHKIDLGEFAVVFATTRDGNVIVERQYKHGTGKVGLVMPAGAVEIGEPPLVAAQRELLEETGYKSDEWEFLGSYTPNGNYGCGKAYMFVAKEAYKIQEPLSGDLEDMEIILMSELELSQALLEGKFNILGSAAIIGLVQIRAMNSCT